jgi:hypothetical protein
LFSSLAAALPRYDLCGEKSGDCPEDFTAQDKSQRSDTSDQLSAISGQRAAISRKGIITRLCGATPRQAEVAEG